MIRVAGSAQCSFIFPAELPMAYAYYADIGRVLSYLPHICLARTFGPDRLRLLYHSTELGIYRIRIFADVQTILEDGRVLHVRPLEDTPAVQAQTETCSTMAQGRFTSQSTFHDMSDRTQIEYSLGLQADLPTPAGLRIMPGAVVSGIARSITNARIHEIVQVFIARSVDAFPHWLAELKSNGGLPAPGSLPYSPPPTPDCPEELS